MLNNKKKMMPNYNSYSEYSIIIDNRTPDDFKKLTFLNHKNTAVFSQLEKNIYNGQIEEACHWTSELICSNKLFELLDFFAEIYSKFININNPTFPHFLLNSCSECVKICNEKKHLQYPLSIRNNMTIRNIICRITICLATSSKGSPMLFKLAKLSNQDFQDSYFNSKITTTQNYLAQIIKQNDNPKIVLVGNQIVHAIITKNIATVVYWISWILQYEKLKLKEDKKLLCEPRMFDGIDPKFYTDITWFIWEIIINIPTSNDNKKQIIALLRLYSHDFSKTKKTHRIPLLLNAMMILISNPNYKTPLMMDVKIVKDALKNVSVLYEEIKIKNTQISSVPSHSPNTHAGMHAGQMHTGQMHTGQMHAGQMHTGQMHAGQMHTGQMHAGQMHAGQIPMQQGLHTEQIQSHNVMSVQPNKLTKQPVEKKGRKKKNTAQTEQYDESMKKMDYVDKLFDNSFKI